jgi:hypothetical protein
LEREKEAKMTMKTKMMTRKKRTRMTTRMRMKKTLN